MKKLLLFIMGLLLPMLYINAQKALTTGDTVPAFVFHQVQQTHADLIILDFWASWCSSCLNCFPLLDSLQQAFGGRLHIVLVNNLTATGEASAHVDAFTQKYLSTHSSFRPRIMIDSSTRLRKLFPFIYLPHYVWIDSHRRIIAITGYKEITYENIHALLNGERLSLPVKSDRYH